MAKPGFQARPLDSRACQRVPGERRTFGCSVLDRACVPPPSLLQSPEITQETPRGHGIGEAHPPLVQGYPSSWSQSIPTPLLVNALGKGVWYSSDRRESRRDLLMLWGQFSARKRKTQEACPQPPHLLASCPGTETFPGDDTEVTSWVTSSRGR